MRRLYISQIEDLLTADLTEVEDAKLLEYESLLLEETNWVTYGTSGSPHYQLLVIGAQSRIAFELSIRGEDEVPL